MNTSKVRPMRPTQHRATQEPEAMTAGLKLASQKRASRIAIQEMGALVRHTPTVIKKAIIPTTNRQASLADQDERRHTTALVLHPTYQAALSY